MIDLPVAGLFEAGVGLASVPDDDHHVADMNCLIMINDLENTTGE
jgi:hypothetical protein